MTEELEPAVAHLLRAALQCAPSPHTLFPPSLTPSSALLLLRTLSLWAAAHRPPPKARRAFLKQLLRRYEAALEGEEAGEAAHMALAETMAQPDDTPGRRVYLLQPLVREAARAAAERQAEEEGSGQAEEEGSGQAEDNRQAVDSGQAEDNRQTVDSGQAQAEAAIGGSMPNGSRPDQAEPADGAVPRRLAPGGAQAVVLEEAAALLSRGTTGLQTWPAAQVLASMVSSPERARRMDGAHVLELGAGPGLAGLAAAKAAPIRRLTLTDAHADVLALLRTNARLNLGLAKDAPLDLEDDSGDAEAREADPGAAAACRAVVQSLDWREPAAAVAALPPATVLLGSDIVFDPALAVPLVNTIAALLEKGGDGAVAWIASTRRNPATYAAFERALAAEARLRCVEVPWRRQDCVLVLDATCEVTVLEIALQGQ